MAAKTTSRELKDKLKAEQRKTEDKSFYTMLTAFAVALVIELTLITLYGKYYAGAYYGFTLRTIMFVFLGITAVAGIAFVASAVTGKFKFLKPLFAAGFVFFAMAVEIRLINTIGIAAIKVGCMAFPVLLVLFLVYVIYQPEFFITAFVGTVAMFAAWLTKSAFFIPILFNGRHYYLSAAAAVIAIIALFTLIVKLNKGHLGKGKWRFRVFEPRTSYAAIFITLAIAFLLVALLLLSEIFLFRFLLLYKLALIVLAAYVFGSAIYYTIKLM